MFGENKDDNNTDKNNNHNNILWLTMTMRLTIIKNKDSFS